MSLSSDAVRRMGKWHVLGLALALLLGGCTSLRVPMNEPLRSAAGNTDIVCSTSTAAAAPKAPWYWSPSRVAASARPLLLSASCAE